MNIKSIRRRALMTQQEFATAIGVAKTTVCNWETGKVEVSIESLKKILEFCKQHNIEV